jgi:hypothetical protein
MSRVKSKNTVPEIVVRQAAHALGLRFRLHRGDLPGKPPAWHWCDSEGGGRDERQNAPEGASFLHGNGVICAPWNRLSYKSVDPRGPHADWVMGDWRNNSHTKGCKTLCAMLLRVYVELNGPNFHKRHLAT